MNKYDVGDLVWVPAGTITLLEHRFIGTPMAKPHWGLVVEVDKLKPNGSDTWLSLKINNIVHRVDQNHVRKIDSEELIYDKISRSSANV
jgi:hypothetical protein